MPIDRNKISEKIEETTNIYTFNCFPAIIISIWIRRGVIAQKWVLCAIHGCCSLYSCLREGARIVNVWTSYDAFELMMEPKNQKQKTKMSTTWMTESVLRQRFLSHVHMLFWHTLRHGNVEFFFSACFNLINEHELKLKWAAHPAEFGWR